MASHFFQCSDAELAAPHWSRKVDFIHEVIDPVKATDCHQSKRELELKVFDAVSLVEPVDPFHEYQVIANGVFIKPKLYHLADLQGYQASHKVPFIVNSIIQGFRQKSNYLFIPSTAPVCTPPPHAVHYLTEFKGKWLCFTTVNHLKDYSI